MSDEVFREPLAREPIFHHPEFGTSRADFDRMMHPDFWEIGASGNRYDRALALDDLEARHAHGPVEESWKVSGAECRALAKDVYLFTYILDHKGRTTRRATIWIRGETGWQIAYHQGTVMTSGETS